MNVLKCSIIELSHGDLDRLSKGEEIGVILEGQRLVLRVPVRRYSAGERGEENTFGGPRPRPTTLNEVDDQQEECDRARQKAIEHADRTAAELKRLRGVGGDPLKQMFGPGELAEG